MKQIFKFILFAALAAAGALTGCNPKEEVKQFGVSFKEAGPGYVTVMATVPSPMTVKYTVSDKPLAALTPTILNMTGTAVTFYADGEQQLLDYEVAADTKYYLYLVGILGESFSDMYTFEFETGEFVFNQLATVVGVTPDGYKMHIKVPESVRTSVYGKPGSTAIRYAQCDLMMYNYMSQDDYSSMLYNGGVWLKKDSTLVYADKVNYGEAGIDVNEDGVVDAEDIAMRWNPIAPGEPVVFMAAEFEWMSEPEEYKGEGEKKDETYSVNGFPFPGGWVDGYYYPCIDAEKYWAYKKGTSTKGAGIITNVDVTTPADDYWTGAFQKKTFRSRIPARLDAEIDVEVSDLRSVNATLTIRPDDNVYRYLLTVLDNGSYETMLKLLGGNEDYLQWAVTSYFAMYNFGSTEVVATAPSVIAPAVTFELTDYFYDVPADTKYHVLVTGMSGDIGSPQCFKHYTFSTPPKTKTKGPTIEVTPLESLSEPYTAVFNVKCTSVADNPAVRCYYGANYMREWVYKVNSSSSYTYESLGQTTQFSADELDKINSEEGYTMYIPTIDGETTRLVVVAFNDENISNGIDEYEDAIAHPAVADCTTPYAVAENNGYNELLDTDALTGEWTISADVLAKDGEATVTKTLKSKVNIKRTFVAGEDYETRLSDEVMKIYKENTKWTEDEIKGFYDEFVYQAEAYGRNRLRNQNKLLIEGWLDHDSEGRLHYMSPWDLFINDSIQTPDVASMFSEFGPKLLLQVNKDVNGKDSLCITANKFFVSPVANWSEPFYMAGRRNDGEEAGNTVFQYSDAEGNFVAPLVFPVELSDDRNTITIKPLVYETDGSVWYPNVIGISENLNSISYVLDYPIVSEVTLTRGWTGAEDDETGDGSQTTEDGEQIATRASVSRTGGVCPVGGLPCVGAGQMTDFRGVTVPIRMKGKVMTQEQVEKNLELYREKYFELRK